MSVIVADERAAFDALYEDTHRKVLAYCVRRTSQWSDTLDAAAETYVVAWRRFDDLPTGDGSLPWLFGIARRVIANQRRTESRLHRARRRLAREYERVRRTQPRSAGPRGRDSHG